MLKGKKILIGITAGIAAYKIPFLIRLLIKEGAAVKVVMTSEACDFVTPLTLSALSVLLMVPGIVTLSWGVGQMHLLLPRLQQIPWLKWLPVLLTICC
jgi:hypothetical protein